MINGVHHISLSTVDIDRLLKFYRDLLGLEQLHDVALREGDKAFETVVGMEDVAGRSAWLRAGNGLIVEIFQFTRPIPRPVEMRPACDAGIRHICFDVTDITAEYERLRSKGITFISPPQTFAIKVRAAYLRDPDGNIVELQEILPGSPMNRGTFAHERSLESSV